MTLPTNPQPPSPDQEEHTLKEALVECKRRLTIMRAEGDQMAADLAEADMNIMLDRLLELSRMPRKPRMIA